MSKFKIGDKVIVINTNDVPQQLFNKTLIVASTSTDRNDHEIVYAGIPEQWVRPWLPGQLQLVTNARTELTDLAPEEAFALLRKGDLVVHRGQVGAVEDIHISSSGTSCWLTMLTSKPTNYWTNIDELIPVNSIYKNTNQL